MNRPFTCAVCDDRPETPLPDGSFDGLCSECRPAYEAEIGWDTDPENPANTVRKP
jgi:hypothetical protein